MAESSFWCKEHVEEEAILTSTWKDIKNEIVVREIQKKLKHDIVSHQ